jgi:hypothetical protein
MLRGAREPSSFKHSTLVGKPPPFFDFQYYFKLLGGLGLQLLSLPAQAECNVFVIFPMHIL